MLVVGAAGATFAPTPVADTTCGFVSLNASAPSVFLLEAKYKMPARVCKDDQKSCFFGFCCAASVVQEISFPGISTPCALFDVLCSPEGCKNNTPTTPTDGSNNKCCNAFRSRPPRKECATSLAKGWHFTKETGKCPDDSSSGDDDTSPYNVITDQNATVSVRVRVEYTGDGPSTQSLTMVIKVNTGDESAQCLEALKVVPTCVSPVDPTVEAIVKALDNLLNIVIGVVIGTIVLCCACCIGGALLIRSRKHKKDPPLLSQQHADLQ